MSSRHRSRAVESPAREPFSVTPCRKKPTFPIVNTPVRRSGSNTENMPPETALTIPSSGKASSSPFSEVNFTPVVSKSASKASKQGQLPSRTPIPRPSSASVHRTLSQTNNTDSQCNTKRKLNLENNAPVQAPAGAIQDQETSVKVIVRMRPRNSKEELEEAVEIAEKVSCDSLRVDEHQFTFDQVAGTDASQQAIFKTIGLPFVENCLQGFNSSIFAYGQTGSGKTYTMWGSLENLEARNHHVYSEDRGLAPRIFEYLFHRTNEEEERNKDKQLMHLCRCSFLEIYNEQITDLLEPVPKSLQIREDTKSGIYVENLTEEYVSNADDVLRLMLKGFANRRVGSTSMNAESSRSHTVFTCIIESRCKNPGDGGSSVRTSRMNLVDLAGSERQKSTKAAGQRLKEAGNINRSLSQLGNVINILAEISQTGKPRHIPYRDSRLTFLLQESLGGNAKLAMICAISPMSSCKNETLSTLRFAQRAKSIQNKAVINEETEDDVKMLREQIKQLKDELMRMKSHGNQIIGTRTSAGAWNARRSYNLLRMSLSRSLHLPAPDGDSDEEMEIEDETDQFLDVCDSFGCDDNTSVKDMVTGSDEQVDMHGAEKLVPLAEDPTEGELPQEQIHTELTNVDLQHKHVDSTNCGSATEAVEVCPDTLPSNGSEMENINVHSDADTTEAMLPKLDIEDTDTGITPLQDDMQTPILSDSPRLRKNQRPNLSVSIDPEALLRKERNLQFRASMQANATSPTDRLAASLYRGLKILENHQKKIRSSRTSFILEEVEKLQKRPLVDQYTQTSPVPSPSKERSITSFVDEFTQTSPGVFKRSIAEQNDELPDGGSLTKIVTDDCTQTSPIVSFIKESDNDADEKCSVADGCVQTSPLIQKPLFEMQNVDILEKCSASDECIQTSPSLLDDYSLARKSMIDLPEVNFVEECLGFDESIQTSPSLFKCSPTSKLLPELSDANIQTDEDLEQEHILSNNRLSGEPRTPLPLDSQTQANQNLEAILAGAIRREQAGEELLNLKNAEIEQLNRLVRQYKHERECNALLHESRESKINRMEGLIDGTLPKDAFLTEEWSCLTNEHKLLQIKFNNHPDVTLANVEQQRLNEELETYKKFYDLGEREVLLKENQQLRDQLQTFIESGRVRSCNGMMKRLEEISTETDENKLQDISTDAEPMPESFDEAKAWWNNKEAKLMSMLEELGNEVEKYAQTAEKAKQEMEAEKRCASEMKEALEMAMEGHARLLDQYAELQEKHIAFLAKHRKMREAMGDAKRRSRTGKWVEAQAAELAALRLDQEQERKAAQEQIEDLQAQLRDTADAVQAAGELLVRLKEAEDAAMIAEDAAELAARDVDKLEREMDRLKRKHSTEIATLQQRLMESRLQKSSPCPMCLMAERVRFEFTPVSAEEAAAGLEADHLADGSRSIEDNQYDDFHEAAYEFDDDQLGSGSFQSD
uniref:Kinesin 12-II protein n=1 Tax=Marsilea vestita TaxID=59764 RepID=A0A142KWC0_MARVE|nr:kinesin 12-II protein [Marsilea vestita]